MTHKEAIEMLDDTLARLGEHFDAVQIVASVYDHAGTRYINRGLGNYYARLGLCSEFIASHAQREQAELIAEKINPEED